MARPKTKTAYESNKAYSDKNYDTFLLTMPRGAKEQLKAIAAEHGVSLSRLILESVESRTGLKLTLDNALPWLKK